MIAIPFPYLLAEFLAFVFLCSRFGFGSVFLAYVLPSFLGFFILAFQSRSAFFTLQNRLAAGDEPGPQLLNTGAKFISGILLVIPFLSTRLLGILLFLPGTRQLLLFLFQAWIFKRFANRMFGPGGMGPGFRAGFRTVHVEGQEGFRETGVEETREERDAEVIDVTPIR